MSAAQRIIKYAAIGFALSLIVGIFGGLYIAFGVLGTIFTGSFGGGDGLDISKYPDSSYILSVDLGISQVEIREGEEFRVDTDNKNVKIKQDHNKIALTEKSNSIFDTDDEKITIYVPDVEFDEIYIANGIGQIKIESLKTKKLTLELGTGETEIKELIVTNKTKIKGGVGEVTIKNANLANVDLELGIGQFNIEGIFSGENDIESGVGELNIEITDSKENYTIETENGIGEIKIDGYSVGDTRLGKGKTTLDIESGVGAVNIRFLEKNDSHKF